MKFIGNAYHSSGSSFKIQWGSTSYSSLDSWRSAKGYEKDAEGFWAKDGERFLVAICHCVGLAEVVVYAGFL